MADDEHTEDASAPESAPDNVLQVAVQERLPVTFFDEVVLAVRAADGLIYLAVHDLCTIVELSPSAQVRRIRAHEDLVEGLVRANIDTGYGIKAQYFLQLDLCPLWLVSVNTRRTRAAVKGRLRHLRRYLITEIYAAFARVSGLPEQSSRHIEDLRDLDRIEPAVTDLAERQSRLEESQSKARLAWRDLDARIRALESRSGQVITPAQRGYLYTLVQAWGAARADHEPQTSRNPYAACWAALKARFHLARYDDLPAEQYADAVAFVRAAYRQLTDTDLDIPEQSELDL